MTGIDLIYLALGVPRAALHSEEAEQRSASTSLLRKTPGLSKILGVVDDPNFTGEWWEQLELTLIVNERVIGAVADAIDEGRLDWMIGRYPDPEHLGNAKLVQIVDELRASIEAEIHSDAWQTLDDLQEKFQDHSLPVGTVLPQWLALMIESLIKAVVVATAPSTEDSL